MEKLDYPPLLSEGFKTISIYQLDDFFLVPFGENEQRRMLIDHLSALIRLFSKLDLKAEIWIDGSFTTQKKEPEDVDLVFVLDRKEVDLLSGSNEVLFKQLLANPDQNKIRYNCDIHLFYTDDQKGREKYLDLFGKDRPKLNSKGIFVININHKIHIS